MSIVKWIMTLCFASMILTAASTAENVKRVAFLRYPLPPMDFKDVVQGYKNMMRQNGYVEGKDIEYIDLVTKTDDLRSVPQVQEFAGDHKDEVDMFITCGWVSMYVRKVLMDSHTPQIFVPVIREVARKMLPSLEEGSRSNISGIYLTYPPEKILKLLKLTLPDAKKYGVCWNSQVPADVVFKQSFDQLKEHMGITLSYFDLNDGVDTVKQQLKDAGVDAFGGCVSFRKPEYLPLFHMDIPIVSAKLDHENSVQMLGSNELVGFWNVFSTGGEQAAEMTLDIWQCRTTIEKIAPRRIRTQIIYVNSGAARRLGIRIPPAVMRIANVIYNK